jgi:RHS repeat-associated protein
MTLQSGSMVVSRVGNAYFFTGRRLDVIDIQNAGTPHHFTDDYAGLQLFDFRARTYDPVSGRFGERDPVGYRDGMGLYEYVGGRPSVILDPSGRQGCSPAGCTISLDPIHDNPMMKWTSSDFVLNYYTHGGGVNLEQIGLLGTFIRAPSVQAKTAEFHTIVSSLVEYASGRLTCKDGQPGRSVEISGADFTQTDVTDQIFSVGGSTFFRTYECSLYACVCNCDKVMSWRYSCRLHYYIRDEFKEPLTFIGWPWEAGGKPYDINGDFYETMTCPCRR